MTTVMATPDDVRRARLAADYEEMRTIRGEYIHWYNNDFPATDYVVTLRVRSYISPTMTRDEHQIRILLSPNHPFEKPTVMMHGMTPIFHPHVWPDGKICIGQWDFREGLASFVVKLARLFQFDPQLIDPHSIANYKAADWFYANPNLFPCDQSQLPVPGEKPTYTFVVKRVTPPRSTGGGRFQIRS
ncbi:MAG: hypothetical protein NZ585_06335 [Chloracidobacterium sp.]|nr:hypothetical protein [Chloracidobacterium sp.]MDW8216081.1 hypothetical protein [Acidobacteriota bacterium]